jgi:[acyl-carrier-protein] S-malonyltransferase
MSIAFVFRGQGSQAVGMGRALAEAFPAARRVFDEVDEALGDKLSEPCGRGRPDPDAHRTQPALLAHSLAVMRVLETEAGVDLARAAAYVAGHSLANSALAVAISRSPMRRGWCAPRARHAEGGAGRRHGGRARPEFRPRSRRSRRRARCAAANDNGGGCRGVGRKAAVERAVEMPRRWAPAARCRCRCRRRFIAR